jgi:uroporphyrinogen-III synthase
LPVQAVGAATAEAARNAGFTVEAIGDGDVSDLLGALPPGLRLLHLTGEDHRPSAADRIVAYRAAEIDRPPLPDLEGLIIAVHSPRAGRRLAELAMKRERTAIAAISEAAAEAAGPGWEQVDVAEQPNDSSLLALAAMLCHTSAPK